MLSRTVLLQNLCYWVQHMMRLQKVFLQTPEVRNIKEL